MTTELERRRPEWIGASSSVNTTSVDPGALQYPFLRCLTALHLNRWPHRGSCKPKRLQNLRQPADDPADMAAGACAPLDAPLTSPPHSPTEMGSSFAHKECKYGHYMCVCEMNWMHKYHWCCLSISLDEFFLCTDMKSLHM